MSNAGSKSVDDCRTFTCPRGYEKDSGVKTSGSCKNVVTFEKCRQLAELHRPVDKNPGFDGMYLRNGHDPAGCFQNLEFNKKYFYNKGPGAKCTDTKKCFCEKEIACI